MGERRGGAATPGMGGGGGVGRMLRAAGAPRDAAPPVDIFIGFDGEERRAEAFKLSMDARREGMNAQMELAGRSAKGQRKQAARVGARWLVLLGEETSVRDLDNGNEIEVAPDTVIARIRREDRAL